ncbi:hypothetical protein [Geotalea sp. SG265]|uniref:hypothetical protein n=1 Tax=Geotalea sp. SG265 TaxID=2922867 RepID=UPI001FAFC371|nr:hypothetical protein [Geotalea sp. SG265]
MKKALAAIGLLVSFIMAGCGTTGGTATVGALGGAAAGGGVYEYRLHQEKQRIENDHKAGKMDDKEYNARKDEIERMQLIK